MQLLESSSELFMRGMETEAKAESEAKEAEVLQQIGKLQMELCDLNNFSSFDASELRLHLNLN